MTRPRFFWALGLLCACATPQPVGRHESPGLESTPARLRAGYFELPAGLNRSPSRLTVAPLDVVVRSPTTWTLDNGLTVYALEDHRAPIVQAGVLVPAGAHDEPDQQLGVSELMFELLVSGGTSRHAPEALDELLDSRAADLWAAAGAELSSVSLSARARDFAQLLPVLADVVRTPRFDEARLKTEKDRLLEDVRRRADEPGSLATRAVLKAVYGPKTLLGREAQQATLEGLTQADVRAFHRRLGPQGARLVVAGDFDLPALKTLVQRAFGDWSGGDVVARDYGAPQSLVRRVIVVPRATAQAHVRIGGWGCRRASPDDAAVRLAATSLASFGIGRIPRVVRDERGLAYVATASVGVGPTTGHFVVDVDTKPEQAVAALTAALSVVERAGREEPLTVDEASSALDATLNSFAFRFEGALKVAWERATLDALGWPQDTLSTFRQRHAAVSLVELNAAAARLGQADALQIVVVGPVEKLGDLSRFGPVVTITDVDRFR